MPLEETHLIKKNIRLKSKNGSYIALLEKKHFVSSIFKSECLKRSSQGDFIVHIVLIEM